MITVRFSSGFSAVYNDARTVEHIGDGRSRLKTSDGRLLAIAPADAIIEFTAPCRVYFAAQGSDDQLDSFLQALIGRTFTLTYTAAAKLRDIKNQLASFDARRRTWK
jgi:hypothetical protein